MDEGDLHPVQAGAGLGVDQLGALRGQVAESPGEIVDVVGDVVHPRPALGEELPHRRLGPERGQQLDPAASDPHRGRLDPLLGHRLALLELGAEQELVGSHRVVEILDGDAEMVDSARLHLLRS